MALRPDTYRELFKIRGRGGRGGRRLREASAKSWGRPGSSNSLCGRLSKAVLKYAPDPGLRIIACIHLLGAMLVYCECAMLLDMGSEILNLKCCELK